MTRGPRCPHEGIHRMNRFARLTAALALSLGTLVALGGAAHAQTADSLLSGFEPSGDWVLRVGGAEVPKARIYFARRAQALLIRSAEFESPVLIDLRGREVKTVDLMKVAERPDGRIDLLADAMLEPAGALTPDRTGAAFTVGGKQAELRQAPYLIGRQKGSDLLVHSAYYRFLAERYSPDSAAVEKLKKEARGVQVLTFFGSWCPHCKEHVPLLLKVEQTLGGSKLDFVYQGMPGGTVADDPEAKKWGVTGVPTSIVLVDGREVGRIPNSGWAHPEKALAEILGAPAKP